MKCPTCPDDRLVMTERSGIEIDYCPTCRGVWLDRGELDKIIERSLVGAASATLPPPTGMAQGRVSSGSPGPTDRADRYPVQRSQDDDRYDRGRIDSDRYDGDRFGDDRHDRHDRYDGDEGKRPKRRRESLLSELFDF